MRFSPGPLVAAAFIGPGTVTTATLAGADYGYALLWGIVFSAVATVVLQEMALRIGVVGREDLGTALRRKLGDGPGFYAIALLVVLAIGIGNAAYEGGNLAGALVGAELLLPEGVPASLIAVSLAALAGALLAFGADGLLRIVLTSAVALMSVAYVSACLFAPVDWSSALSSFWPARLPDGAELRVIGLIGTTVVPYNLFLHASTARDFYETREDLAAARRDLYFSVGVGALITLAIALVAAALRDGGTAIRTGADLAAPLREVMGGGGRLVVGLGYLAAGLTSAVTAPLATALAFGGLFAWPRGVRGSRSTFTWATTLAIGTVVVCAGIRPVWLITTAQVANGVFLPVIAACVLWVANDRRRLSDGANGLLNNFLGVGILALTLLIGGKTLYALFV